MWNFQGLKNRTGCISIQWGQGEKDFPLVSARAAPDRPALCVALCPLVSCGICSFRVLQKSHGKAKKSLPPLTSFACCHYCRKRQRVTLSSQGFKVYVNADRLCGRHYCRKGQRVTPFSQGFKVYANADRLCGCHYCRKGQRVTPNYKGLGSRLYCFGFSMMPPRKGQRVTALCPYPLPQCAVICFRACMKVLIEIPFYQTYILARTYIIMRVRMKAPMCGNAAPCV